MVGFDPELYLRVKGEDVLLGGTIRHWQSPLDESASALVAVGAIELDAAQTIVDDYADALSLRDEQAAHMARMRRAAAVPMQPEPVSPGRVVLCSLEVERQEGTLEVRSVLLEENMTSLGVRYREKDAKRWRRGAMTFGGSRLSGIKVSDDAGTVSKGRFSGSGSAGVWRGRLLVTPALHVDATWIEIDGERIVLEDGPVADVRVEELLDEDPAFRFLWHRLATPHHMHHPVEHLDAAIDALLACGAVSSDDPQLADVRAVAAAHSQQMTAPGGRRKLPEPWRSLFARRGRANGPRGEVKTYATTPRIDGTVVEIMGLESSEDGFTLEVASAGGRAAGAFHFESQLGQSRLAWWATDDLGNNYLGAPGGGGGSNDSWAGTIDFEPALDPKATVLDVTLTGSAHRCIVRIPLDWQPPSERDDEDDYEEEVFV